MKIQTPYNLIQAEILKYKIWPKNLDKNNEKDIDKRKQNTQIR